MANYGKVYYIGPDPYWTTRGYEPKLDEPNPEGGFLYEFYPSRNVLPIQSKMDLEYFLARPNLYEVELAGGRQAMRRPAKAAEPAAPAAGTVVVPSASAGAPAGAPGRKKE